MSEGPAGRSVPYRTGRMPYQTGRMQTEALLDRFLGALAPSNPSPSGRTARSPAATTRRAAAIWT